jgi:hypothetical protein
MASSVPLAAEDFAEPNKPAYLPGRDKAHSRNAKARASRVAYAGRMSKARGAQDSQESGRSKRHECAAFTMPIWIAAAPTDLETRWLFPKQTRNETSP